MKKNRMKALAMALLVTAGAAFAGGRRESVVDGRELYRVEVYTQLANYSGMQVGWFAKLVKDKFNMELNIIPSAEGVYATRMAAGNLGDLVVFGHNGEEFTTAIEAGMLLDWNKGDLLETYGRDIKANLSRALRQNADVFGGGTACYGFGHNVASNPSVTEAPFYHPDIRFDLYRAIGSPEIPNLMGYLDVLKRMVDYQPVGDSGLPAYAISLFSDWDGDTVMSVKCIGAFYGYDEFGFTLYNVETNTAQPVLDPDSYYMQGLKFFNRAYQMGILDPDSATQTFSDVSNKYNDGRVYWSIFSWLGPANYNTPERLAEGKGMFGVPARDQKNIVYGSPIYGGDRIWSIGSKAKHPGRIMELINWLCTPDGVMQSTYGPQGVTWNYDANNKPYLTPLGIGIHEGNPNMEMPAEAGGGLWVDGQNKINNTTFTVDEINPVSGERYNREYWSSELSRQPSRARKVWQDAMGARSEDEYLTLHNQKAVVTASDFVYDTRSVELEQKYKQVSTAIRDGTWRAIYAANDAEFDRLVADMIRQAKGFGYDECVAWDLGQAARRAAAVRRALGS
jgi:multiple sugar transport system substrate-binding protein/putative aldouronate transport system substrate-binding protein